MNRAYALLDVRSVDDEKRVIEGIATTPTPDRMRDVISTDGIEFNLPLPLLYQHDPDRPIGHVIEAKVTKSGIRVKVQVAKAGIASFIDEAWALIKNKLVRGFSIGFRPLEDPEFDKESGGFIFPSTEWLELSAVTIPANAEASILTIKSFDTGRPAASGNTALPALNLDKQHHPGVTGLSKGKSMKPITETISEWEAKNLATTEQMSAIMNKSTEEARDLTAEEDTKYEELKAEKERCVKHIDRLREHERLMALSAKPVTKSIPMSDHAAAAGRSGSITVRSNAPKGIFPARMVIAMYKAGNNPMYAAELCRKHWPDMPELELTCKAIVEAGDTTTSGWASQLVPSAQQLQGEFLDMFRAATIIERLPGITRVPFNVAVPIRTAGGTAAWVGEAAPKPVSSETFTNVTLRFEKGAFIIPISQELARFSSPSAETLIRDSMIKTMKTFFDTHFVSATAAVSNVSPAGILNGITGVAASGTTMAAAQADLAALIGRFVANGVPLDEVVLLLSSGTAAKLGLARTDLGVRIFPGLSRTGGELESFPVVVSETVGNKIIGVYAPDVLLAEDPAVNVTASDQATIEMDSAPAIGEQSPPSTASVYKSAFQYNLIFIRAEQFRTWKVARAASVEFISNVAYVPGT